MLFYDVPYGHIPSVAVADGDAEHSLGFKDPERVMPKGTMPKIAKSLLSGVYYLDNRDFRVRVLSSPC